MVDDKSKKNVNSKAFGLLLIIVFVAAISPAYAGRIEAGIYAGDSFIDPTAFIDVGNFSIGDESYIAPFTAFTGVYAYIGSHSNVQDSGTNSGSIKIKDDAVVAHGAELTGEVEIGSRAFIGFNDVIVNSKIGDGAYIGIGSKVIGIDIPARRSVPQGTIIDSPDDIARLKPVTEEQEDFVQEVIEVNRALAAGYSKLFESSGASGFGNVAPNGDGDIIIDGKDILSRKGSNEPIIGADSIIEPFSRVIGDVFIGENSWVDNGTSIRGDEGIPIRIGKNARIGKNNTFHSLNDKEVVIGDDFKVGSDSVIHGPVIIGYNVQIGSRAVAFKSTIGNDVIIGDNAIVVGVDVPNGTVIPSNSIISTQRDVRILNPGPPAPGSKTASIINLGIVAMIPILIGLAGSYFLRDRRH